MTVLMIHGMTFQTFYQTVSHQNITLSKKQNRNISNFYCFKVLMIIVFTYLQVQQEYASTFSISDSESESIFMTGSDLACSNVIVGGGEERTSMMDLDVAAIGLDEELELLDVSSN